MPVAVEKMQLLRKCRSGILISISMYTFSRLPTPFKSNLVQVCPYKAFLPWLEHFSGARRELEVAGRELTGRVRAFDAAEAQGAKARASKVSVCLQCCSDRCFWFKALNAAIGLGRALFAAEAQAAKAGTVGAKLFLEVQAGELRASICLLPCQHRLRALQATRKQGIIDGRYANKALGIGHCRAQHHPWPLYEGGIGHDRQRKELSLTGLEAQLKTQQAALDRLEQELHEQQRKIELETKVLAHHSTHLRITGCTRSSSNTNPWSPKDTLAHQEGHHHAHHRTLGFFSMQGLCAHWFRRLSSDT
eukprot:1157924-Pelagomonas_calceolata.AAC.11